MSQNDQTPTDTPETAPEALWLEAGELDFDAEPYDGGIAFQVDGCDLVHITDVDEETGWGHITVFTSSDSNAAVLFSGPINVRERRNQPEGY